MFLFFSSIWASSVLFPVLIHLCSNKLQLVYLAITSHVACWKSHKFPISEGKKEISKNFPKHKSIVYKKLLIDSKRLLWYMFLFLTEHNPTFTSNFTVLNLFLFWPNLSFDVLIKSILINKRVYLTWFFVSISEDMESRKVKIPLTSEDITETFLFSLLDTSFI